MTVLTYLTEASIRDNIQTMEGEVLTRPALLKTDGTALTWAADVKISTTDSRGVAYYTGPINARLPGGGSMPLNLPPGLTLDPVLNPAARTLHNVPVAPGNRSLAYADIGAAVTLTRTRFGRFEITGFSKTKPGNRTRYPVDISSAIVGPVQDLSITVRALTLGELSDPTYGAGFGYIPLGAYAKFIGTRLIEVLS